MKILKRFLIVFAVLLVVFFIGASIYVKAYGKAFVEEALTNALEKNVVLGKASYSFPFGFRAQNIRIAQSSEVGGFFEAEDIVAQLSPETIYQGQLIFDSVVFIKPLIVIKNTKEPEDTTEERIRRHGVVIPPDQTALPTAGDVGDVKESQDANGPVEVRIKQFVLKQGRLEYTSGPADKDFSFGLEDVWLKAGNLVFPLKPGRTDFSISGRLVKEGNPLSGSSIEGRGWVDAANRDMEAKIEVVEKDGSVGMIVEAVAIDNNMDVSGEIRVRDLLFGADKQASSKDSAINDLILGALSSAGVEIGAKFAFKTKMDNFHLEQVSFSGSVMTK